MVSSTNTGVPGVIGGQSARRVIHSKVAGVFTGVRRIGDIVKEGDVVARIDGVEVLSPLDGVLRGILDDGLTVPVVSRSEMLTPEVMWSIVSPSAIRAEP